MKRFELIKNDIEELHQSVKNPLNRNLCIAHHKTVLENIQKLTDNECLYIAAYMHDIGLYLGLLGKHAVTSANYTKEFLRKYDCFSEDEIKLIYDVIRFHSDKDKKHFYEAELLKQADIDAHSFSDFM